MWNVARLQSQHTSTSGTRAWLHREIGATSWIRCTRNQHNAWSTWCIRTELDILRTSTVIGPLELDATLWFRCIWNQHSAWCIGTRCKTLNLDQAYCIGLIMVCKIVVLRRTKVEKIKKNHVYFLLKMPLRFSFRCREEKQLGNPQVNSSSWQFGICFRWATCLWWSLLNSWTVTEIFWILGDTDSVTELTTVGSSGHI